LKGFHYLAYTRGCEAHRIGMTAHRFGLYSPSLLLADTFRALIPFIVVALLAVLAMRDVRLANSVRLGAPAREPSAIPEQ
jgi:hypothetical protein